MKGKGMLGALCLLAVLVFLVCPAAAEENANDQVIKVTGFGESTTAPDKVTVNLGVEFTDTNAATVQKKAADAMKKIIAAVKSAGIKESDITTNKYSMYSYTVGEYNEGTYPKGTVVYAINSSVKVVSYDVDAIGTVIDKAVSAGANSIGSLQFGLSNEKQISERKAALQSAVKAARADADAVAEALGIRITAIGLVSIGQSSTPVSYAEVPMAAEDAVVMTAKATSGANDLTVSAGELSTTATVSIAYIY
ncbi:MAG TPA: SIMPL domain-containing protein [Methanocorpusculum sp.]|nr:SIMPL domain-containing protein [Methanocorpusculum sp.]